MKRWQSAVLTVSLISNCGLIAVHVLDSRETPVAQLELAAPAPDQLQQVHQIEQARREQLSIQADVRPDEVKALHSKLLEANVSETQATAIVVALVETSYRPSTPQEYWVAPDVRAAREQAARFQQHERARELLITAFGPAIAEHPAAASLFAPYSREFPFLASSKQRELERLVATGQGSSAENGYAPDQRAVAAAIRTLLSAEEWTEFQMRTSPISRQLLSVGFTFTEAEFRKVFAALLSRPNADGQTPPAFTAGTPDPQLRHAMESALGSARFVEYSKRQDPTYQVLQALSKSYGVKDTQIEAAYKIIQASAAEAGAIQSAHPVLTNSARSQLYAVTSQRDEKLRDVLGEQAYAVAARSLAVSSPNYQATSIPIAVRPDRGEIVREDLR
jgi:hypothetical protein